MGYGYRSGYRQRSYPQSTGRVSKPNRRPGACRSCGETVPAFGGQLWREASGEWSVVHVPAEWAGSPVSGHYVGGCPASTDAQNDGAPWNRDGHVRSERERIASRASLAAAMSANREAPRDRRGGYVDECGSCGMASCSC